MTMLLPAMMRTPFCEGGMEDFQNNSMGEMMFYNKMS
jgi:hypothetical protein